MRTTQARNLKHFVLRNFAWIIGLLKKSPKSPQCLGNQLPTWINQPIEAQLWYCSDIPLVKDRHLEVVNKLACSIEKLTPQEVPSFVYQLLRLCHHQNSRYVFLKLQQYFGLRIYCGLNFTRMCNNENSSDLDVIGWTIKQFISHILTFELNFRKCWWSWCFRCWKHGSLSHSNCCFNRS